MILPLTIHRSPLIEGFYSLGFLKEKYSEIEWIVCLENGLEIQVEELKTKIDQSLELNKPIALVIWDENIIFTMTDSLRALLNSYSNQPMWLVTQLDEQCQLIYRFQNQITCKILELPWWWLNDCLMYYYLRKSLPITAHNDYNYLCMTRRTDQHKVDLVKELEKQHLDQYGLITFMHIPKNFENNQHIRVTPHDPYKNCLVHHANMSAQGNYLVNENKEKIWVSKNVENFIHIENTYADVPLVLQAETNLGIFFTTEKSLWPLLLGKMILIYARPGIMKSIQRFYDFDISLYADLAFDSIDGYNCESQTERLQRLVGDNQVLIKNSREIYKKYQPELETARFSLGKNLLDFCQRQINVVLNKEN